MSDWTGTPRRRLGTDGPEVSALGMGCWAIGGPYWRQGSPNGWGTVDDDESVRALRRAFELGVNFFDTADVYGCGHSESLIGRALGDVRDQLVIATKVGFSYVEETRESPGPNAEPNYIRWACDESLRRLGTDYIDLYQFHLGDYDLERAPEVLNVFEELVQAGKVRSIGWSTNDRDRAALFARSACCKAIQQPFNVFEGNTDLLAFCEEQGLASIARGPLEMGFLTGKYTAESTFPADDVRHGFSSADADELRTWTRQLATSAMSSPPTAARSVKVRSAGCGLGATYSSPSQASAQSRKSKRTLAPSASAR
jgi:aryl-alcohol dehydrogenase-like predicted oxidoreductase